MNKILLAVFALFLVACGGEVSSDPGIPSREPGQVCVVEGQIGGRCTPGRCLDGTPVPSDLVCSDGHWACHYDATRCSTSTTPTTCRESDRPMTCDNLVNVYCPGTNIPVQSIISCRDGRWQCHASLAHCPSLETDAGPPADAQVSPDAGGLPRLTFGLSFDGPASQGFAPGMYRAIVLRFHLQFSEEVELRSLPVTLEARTTSDTITSANRQLVANSIRLVNLENGETVLGPVTPPRMDEITGSLTAFVGTLEGTGLRMEAHRGYELGIVVSLPERVDPELFGRRFRVRIGENARLLTSRSLYRVQQGAYFVETDPLSGENPPSIEGNLMWIEQPRVTVSLADFEPQQIVTRNHLWMHTLRVRYSSSGLGPVFPIRVRYTGVADLGAGYRTQNFSRAVVACGHNCDENGATPRISPTLDGQMSFERFTGPIANAARTCSIICATDSVVDGRDGDRIALGIANASDVVFEDQYGNPALVSLEERLQRQLSAPTHTTTIVSSGYLTINNFSVPNREVTGPVSEWLRIGTYVLNVSYEDALLSSVGVRIDGASRCVNEVRVQTSTSAPATAFVPSDVSHVDVFWESPVALGLGNTTLDIYVRVNPAVAPMVNLNGCHPGDSVTVSIDYGDTSGEWGSFFGSAANLRVLGTNSGLLMQYGGRPGPGGSLLFR